MPPAGRFRAWMFLSRELCPPLPWLMHEPQFEVFASAWQSLRCCSSLLLLSHKFVMRLKISTARPAFIQLVHPVAVLANFAPATQGQAFASTLRVAGGLPPFRFWVAQGTLPAGLSLNSSTGVISGVPAVSGTFAFIVEAIDSRYGIGRRLLQFNVAPRVHYPDFDRIEPADGSGRAGRDRYNSPPPSRIRPRLRLFGLPAPGRFRRADFSPRP